MHPSRRPLPKVPAKAESGARVTVVVAHYPKQPNSMPMATWVLPGHIPEERAKMYVLTSEDNATGGGEEDNEFRDPKYTWYVDQTFILD